MLYNETLDIISSSDNNKTSNSCIVYIIIFSVFLIINISMAIYVYFFLYLKNRSTNPHYFWCLNIMAIRQLNIEGRTYYFYNDLINIKTFNSDNLKLDKKTCCGQ